MNAVFDSFFCHCDQSTFCLILLITRLENMKEDQAAEEDGDATVLMGLIEKPVVGTGGGVHPGTQAASAWEECINTMMRVC